MPRVLRTEVAEESLLDIGRFIAQQAQSLDAGMRVLDKVDEKCRVDATQPLMGQSREDLGPSVRCFPVDSLVVICRPIEDGILVLLVVHGRQDVPEIFRRVFWME